MQAINNQREPDIDGKREKAGKESKVSPSDLLSNTAKKNFLDITALIRSIQRAEGQPECFREGMRDCDQIDCKWRSFCLEGQHASDKESK
jgi:hypothetical protein